jgi:uncharacterized damage-inducible protein DinB
VNETLIDMFRYNKWATLTLFEVCRDLPDALLDARVEGTSGPARELLVHIVGGQQSQVLRTQGRQHEDELTRRSPWPGWDELFELAVRSSDELIAIAAALDERAEVDLTYRGHVYRFPRFFFVTHALTHGVEHRTEVKVALGHLGVKTPDLDGWHWAAAAGHGAEVP